MMLVWAKGKKHISGYGVIWTWLVIVLCGVVSAAYFGLESMSDYFAGHRGPFEIAVGVLYLLVMVCLVMFLYGVREGALGVLGLAVLCGIGLVLSATLGERLEEVALAVVAIVVAAIEVGFVLLMHGSEMTHLTRRDK